MARPAAPAAVAPVVVHPTAAERRAAAARRARAKAARIARAKRAAAAKQRAALARSHRRERAQTQLSPPVASSSSSALPYLLAVFATALLLLGLALTPAWAIPWSRASHFLEDRRDELGVIGGMSVVATLLFFLLVQVSN